MYTIERTDKEIDEVMDKVATNINEGKTKFRGMTFEEGIDAVVRWLTGDTDDNPMED